MALGALTAVGAVFQTLYEYYNVHKRNKGLLDILEGFSTNLTVSIDRLQKRDEMLTGKPNPALDSIQRNFENARTWLLANDKNLRSAWTALQASDKLRDLDDRLMKAFASKMGVAIFSALQDTREATQQIQNTLDGMQGNLEVAVREASRDGLREAIRELKEEAYAVRHVEGQGFGGVLGGFNSGEAEKIISQLVDQLSEQERLREEEEALGLGSSYPPLVPYASASSHRSRPNSFITSTFETSRMGEWGDDSMGDGRMGPNGSYSSFADEQQGGGARLRRAKGKSRASSTSSNGNGSANVPPGSIVFAPTDPITGEDLVDPVLANDGLIHERWSLVKGKHKNVRDPSEPLFILGEVAQLREAIFQSFPERRSECDRRRSTFREETITLYETGDHSDLPDLVDRLSHILLWEHLSVSMRIRRATARYRLRDLELALSDLDEAVELSTRGEDGSSGQHEPDVDALRIRALVKDEMHDVKGAEQDLALILASSKTDILSLSIRAWIRGQNGDLKGAQDDIDKTNAAITENKAYRTRLGDGDVDLEYLMRGWAFMSIGDFSSATADFNYSLGLRKSPEPHTLACRGLAKVNNGIGVSISELIQEGLSDMNDAMELVRSFADEQVENVSLSKYTSGAPVVKLAEDGLPTQAFGIFFLRGMAFFGKHDFSLALSDFDHGMRLRPSIVKDTGEFRFALGQMRAETGDKKGAASDFDFAVALQPEQRFVFNATRQAYGI